MQRRLFFTACASPNPAIVMRMVREGVDVNLVFDSGKTALFYAVRHLDIKLVNFLLERGADIDASRGAGWSLLNLALYEAAISERVDSADALSTIIPRLHAAGAIYDGKDERACRALVQYGSLKMLHWFFSNGGTLLTIPELVAYLAENCVDLNVPDLLGKTRLYKAVEHRSLETVEALIKAGAMIDYRSRNGAPLHAACTLGDLSIANALLQAGASPSPRNPLDGNTPLLAAVSHANLEVALLLLQNGANLDECDHLGMGVLHKAIGVWDIDPMIFHALISIGADVSDSTSYSTAGDCMPLLHFAARRDCIGAIRELLLRGVPINEKTLDSRGFTALHLAAMFGSTEAVKFLLARGADPTLRDARGRLPLGAAIRNRQRDVVSVFAQQRAAINALEASGLSPLHLAIGNLPVEDVEALLNAGADVTALDVQGRTALHYAAYGCQFGVVAALIEAGSNINARDFEDTTPLHVAVNAKHAYAVEILLREGANAELRDAVNNQTPLELAIETTFIGGIMLLKQAMKMERIV